MSLDVITLAKINELKASGGVGYISAAQTFTFDGKGENTTTIDSIPYVAIATGKFDLNNIIGATVYDDGESVMIPKDTMVVTTDGNGVQRCIAQIHGLNFAVIVVRDGQLYVFCSDIVNGQQSYISKVEFTGTPHTIDPKFLPSGVTPRKVINLDEYHGTDNGIDETSGFPVSQRIGAMMMGYPQTTNIGLRGGNIPTLKKMLCENENVSVSLTMGNGSVFIAHACQTLIYPDGENTIRRHGYTCFIDVTGEWKLYCLWFICYNNTDDIDIDIKHVFA